MRRCLALDLAVVEGCGALKGPRRSVIEFEFWFQLILGIFYSFPLGYFLWGARNIKGTALELVLMVEDRYSLYYRETVVTSTSNPLQIVRSPKRIV